MQRILPGTEYPLHTVTATRRIEQAAMAALPEHTLMQRAGQSVARLALAIAPHAQRIWVACGPGNNGGDGMEAATHLLQLGKIPIVTWLGNPAHLPADAKASLEWARAANVTFTNTPPDDCDCTIDALLGIGASRPADGRLAEHITRLNALRKQGLPVLSVDIPSGLDTDTGHASAPYVQASHTLALLTLKPGLYTAQGRDAAGDIWFDNLGTAAHEQTPDAHLNPAPARHERTHASHKGSYGDVAVIGGASGMGGAALLAARAALQGGAGRVYVGLLDQEPGLLDTMQPELMLREPAALIGSMQAMSVVCGCGGGNAVQAILPDILANVPRLVLDADALNAIAADTQLQSLLQKRARHDGAASAMATILTPHPLEAARLLGIDTASVQKDRLTAAQELSRRHACTVVLKGSGTVIAAPGKTPRINPTGNARLATAGTGDVLAGYMGARLAQGLPAFDAACAATYLHGLAAEQWPAQSSLTASTLATRIGY